MSAATNAIKRKKFLLQLAETLGDVSKTCRLMGYHRDSFHEIRRAYQIGGLEAEPDRP